MPQKSPSETQDTLVYKVHGEWGHFRKVFTTTSPLTYGIPPRTAVTGLTAAILGIGRETFPEVFTPEKCAYSISLDSPVKKSQMPINLVKTKDETENLLHPFKNPPERIERIQVPFEMLKNPRYKVYLKHVNEDILDRLEKMLENGKTVYTPYLGITECIAEIEYVGRYNSEKIESTEDEVSINSVMEKGAGSVLVEAGKKYEVERQPFHLDSSRKPLSHKDILFESNGDPIRVKDVTYHRVDGQNVVFP